MPRFSNRLRWASAPKGQALVELALILPVLLILAMGTLDVGRVFSGYLSLANAAREGALYAALHADDPNLTADVTNNAVNPELNGQIPGSTVVVVSAPAGSLGQGNPVSVSVSATYPLISTAILGWKSLTLKSSATVMVQCSPGSCLLPP